MKKRVLSILLALSVALTLAPTAWMGEITAQEAITAYAETTIVPGTKGQPDNDELFAGYVEKALYGDLIGGPRPFRAPAASRLTGVNAALYGKRKDFVSDIAGKGGDTTITFTPDELGITKTTFTSAERNMEGLLLITGSDGKPTFAEGVVEAICLRMFDPSAIFNPLLADCAGGSAAGAGRYMWNIAALGGTNSITSEEIQYDADYSFNGISGSRVCYRYNEETAGLWGKEVLERSAAKCEAPAEEKTLTCTPDALTATYGQTLSELYPSGTVVAADAGETPVEGIWGWEDPFASVGNVGSHIFMATFIPEDCTLDMVMGIEVPVTVCAKTIPPDVTLDKESYPYTGSAITPAVTVMDGTNELTEGIDYTVAYESNTDAGTAEVTVTGKGNYTGSVSRSFAITKADQAPLTKTEYVYYGAAAGTVTLPVPNVAGTLGETSYTAGETADNDCILKDAPAVAGGVLTYTLAGGLTDEAVGRTAAVTVNVSSANYDDYTVTVTIILVNKSSQEPTAVNPGYIPGPSADSTAGNTGKLSAPSTPGTPAPDAVVTVSSSRNEVTARPEAGVSGSAAAVTVPEEMGRALVNQAVESGSGTVTIAPVIPGGVGRAEVTIPASVAEDLVERTGAELKVETPAADVSISRSALDDLAQRGGDVSVSVEKTGNMVSVELSANGQPVSGVSGGVTAAVAQSGCTAGTVAMLVQQDGSTQVIRQSVADPDTGTVYVPLDGSAKVVLVDNSKSFSDVPASDWASDAVAFVSSRELMSGDGSGTFHPSASMTRGMLAVVLYNLENNPSDSVSAGFSDVGGEWYAEAVQWAAGRQIVTGYADGHFGPDDSISREQLAVMLYRYAGSPAVSGAALHFSDAGAVSDYAGDAIAWAVSVGVMNGKGSGILDPQGGATRAEVAQMLMNFVSASVK